MTSTSRPIIDVNFNLLPDASVWPNEYFKDLVRSAGATFSVASGWGVIDNGTAASFAAGTNQRVWAYPIDGDKFELVARVRPHSATGNITGLVFTYRAGSDIADTRYDFGVNDVGINFNKRVGFSGTTGPTFSFSSAANAILWVRLRVIGDKQMARVWLDGTAEPQTWQLVWFDPGATRYGKFYVQTWAADGSHRTNSIGEMHLREIGDVFEPILFNATTATFNGTGAQTAFVVSHGLDNIPTNIQISPRSSAASAARYISAVTATSFTVTFTAAPASGTGNVVFDWEAKVV